MTATSQLSGEYYSAAGKICQEKIALFVSKWSLLFEILPYLEILSRRYIFQPARGVLKMLPSNYISYVGLSQILAFSLVTHSDHSEIFRIFPGSWYYL